MNKKKELLKVMLALAILMQGCYKKDIQFGTDLGETFTRVVNIDTVSINMSTVAVDSFQTNTNTTFLLGRYKDPLLGVISAKPFLQLSLPSDITLSDDAVYDSLTFIIKLNGYSYGDTTRSETININELSAPIEYTYGSNIYNTSSVSESGAQLGSHLFSLRQASNDSVSIRLSDVKGQDLFNKLKEKAEEVSTADNFSTYFKGIDISYSDADFSAIYGLNASPDSIMMRLHYHTSIPYPVTAYKQFSFDKSKNHFNQILSDRTGTPISALSGQSEIASTQTNNQAFTQASSGLLLKTTFPSLRDILKINSNVKLLKATLVLRTAAGSNNNNTYKLPPYLFLTATNSSNTIGSQVTNNVPPVVDNIYNTNASFTFDVTNYINNFLNTSGSENNGFYVMEGSPGSASEIDRTAFLDSEKGSAGSQLILSVLTIQN